MNTLKIITSPVFQTNSCFIISILSFYDLVLTMILIHGGYGFSELNPVMNMVLTNGGSGCFILFKIASIIPIVSISFFYKFTNRYLSYIIFIVLLMYLFVDVRSLYYIVSYRIIY